MNCFKNNWILMLLLLFGFKAESQVSCYTDELLNHHIKNTKGTQKRLDLFDNAVYQYLQNQPPQLAQPAPSANNTNNSGTNITIPVVVYVVHNNGPENITDNQVLSQINVLNTYFSSYSIQFCLATTDGSTPLPGSTTPGIIRVENAALINHNANTDQAALTSVSNLPGSRYLRIWVVNDINNGTANGYSMLPDVAPAAFDGIVMAHDAFGDIATCGCSTLNTSSQDGKILVHEVGHYLGLYHTFEDGCAGMDAATCEQEGDRVCDTPPVASPNSGCPGGSWNTCNESPDNPDDINNYMDYTNETCLTEFTAGQCDRMHGAISLYRSQLVSSQNHVHTGINCNGGLLAGFTVSNSNPCVGTQVTFEASVVTGASYDWDFGDGFTATGAIVNHTYNTAFDPAQVKLTVSNSTNSVSAIQSVYVDACTPIVSTEGHWYFFDRGGLDFSSGAPVYDNQAFVNNTFNIALSGATNESCAVQSDASGNLLFYTDGIRVWDENHTTISGLTLHGDLSSMNGVMIVPDPGNASEYYVFTSDERQINGRGFKYTKLQVNGTTVSTVSGQINVPITVPTSTGFNTASTGAVITGEAISAVATTTGYWIITETIQNGTSSHFLVFDLNSTGISFSSSTFVTNLIFPRGPNDNDPVNIQVSPDGKRVVLAAHRFAGEPDFVFDFNVCDGSFTNQRMLPEPENRGMEFSSDSRLLYGVRSNNVYQYNLEPCEIEVTNVSDVNSQSGFSGLQMGPDNKLYMTVYADNHFATIHKPNELATPTNPNACQFNFNGPAMQNNTILRSGLPNMISATEVGVFSNTIEFTSTPCESECFKFDFIADLCANSYAWNFGDPTSGTNNTSTDAQPSHVFSGAGTYTVTLVADGVTITTTVEVGVGPDIEGLLTVCPSVNNFGSYSVDVPNGYTVNWTATNGNVIGLSNQPSVVVDWATLPGMISAVFTNTATECVSTNSETITEFCGADCNCELNPEFFWTITQDCKFSASGVSGAPACLTDVTYSWDFGDGNTATGVNVLHEFNNPGIYNICLTVTGNNGEEICVKEFCKEVKIPCEVPCPSCEDFTVKFDYDVNKDLCLYSFKGYTDLDDCYAQVEYFWDFGDGFTSVGETTGHIFQASGNYNVCLTVVVYDEKGKPICKEEYCEWIRVRCDGEPCPCTLEPYFDIQVNGNCDYTFIGQSGSTCTDIQSYEWYVNGAGPYTGQMFNQEFEVNTEYEICLVVTGIVNGELCKEKYCEKYFFTDCYPNFDKLVQPIVQDNSELVMYPNPAGSMVNIELSLIQDEDVQVVLRTIDGRVIKDYPFNLTAGEQVLPIDLPQSIDNGLIIVEVRTSYKTFTNKLLVKQH